jgi:hypothetical protein
LASGRSIWNTSRNLNWHNQLSGELFIQLAYRNAESFQRAYPIKPENRRYLTTKATRTGHRLDSYRGVDRSEAARLENAAAGTSRSWDVQVTEMGQRACHGYGTRLVDFVLKSRGFGMLAAIESVVVLAVRCSC